MAIGCDLDPWFGFVFDTMLVGFGVRAANLLYANIAVPLLDGLVAFAVEGCIGIDVGGNILW